MTPTQFEAQMKKARRVLLTAGVGMSRSSPLLGRPWESSHMPSYLCKS